MCVCRYKVWKTVQLRMSEYQFLNIRVTGGFYFLLFPYLCFLIFLIHPSTLTRSLAEPFCECAWHWALAWGARRAVKTERPVFTEVCPRDRDRCVRLMTARRDSSEVPRRVPGQAHGAGRPGRGRPCRGPEWQEENAGMCRSGGRGLGADGSDHVKPRPAHSPRGGRADGLHAYIPGYVQGCCGGQTQWLPNADTGSAPQPSSGKVSLSISVCDGALGLWN